MFPPLTSLLEREWALSVSRESRGYVCAGQPAVPGIFQRGATANTWSPIQHLPLPSEAVPHLATVLSPLPNPPLLIVPLLTRTCQPVGKSPHV